MSLQNLAHHVQSAGRGDDKVLVHMTPKEVGGLQALAMAHGGSLTINPETGLPEAGFLSSILPMVAGFALGPAGFGLMSATSASLLTGAVTTVATGSLGKGIMAGLGAYGGAQLGSSLMNAGTAATALSGTPTVAPEVAASLAKPGLAQTIAQQPAASMGATNLTGAAPVAAAAPSAVPNLSSYTNPSAVSLGRPTDIKISQPGLGANLSAVGQGIKQVTSSPETLWNFAKENPMALAGVASSIYSGAQEQYRPPAAQKGMRIPIMNYEYDYPIGVAAGRSSERNYFPNAGYTPTGRYYGAEGGLAKLAAGGPVEEMSRLNTIGANTGYPMANQMSSNYASSLERPISENIIRPIGDANVDPYTGEQKFARGGSVMFAKGGAVMLANGGMAFADGGYLSPEQVQQMYTQVFNRPADPAGLAHYTGATGSKDVMGLTTSQLGDIFRASPEYQTNLTRATTATTGGGTTTNVASTGGGGGATSFVPTTGLSKLYEDVLSRPYDDEGLKYWTGEFGSTLEPAEIKRFTDVAQKELTDRGIFNTTTQQDTAAKATTDAAAAKAAADAAAAKAATTKGGIYVGGGYDYRGEESSTDTEAVESPFAGFELNFDPATGSFAPRGPSAPQGYATPSQVADIYERVLGRTPDLPGLEYYARQKKMTPAALERTLQESPEFFTSLTKPLVPEITYDREGYASIEGAPAYNPAQYGFPGEIRRRETAMVPTAPVTPTTPTIPGSTTTPGGTTTSGGITGGTTGGATDTVSTISKDPNAYRYNYFENTPEENALIRQFQTGPNEKARADLTELYLTKLGRLPDEAGFNHYLNTIGKDNDISKDDENLFLKNAEGEQSQARGLQSLYNKYLNRAGDMPGREYWMGEIGRAGGVTPEIERAFELGAKKEVGMGNAGYRSDLYDPNRMGSRITQEESAQLKAEAPFRFGTDAKGIANNYAREQLLNLYKENLGRTLPDEEGFNWWLSQIGQDNRIDANERAQFLERAKAMGETVKMAAGGVANLGSYSDGGRLLRGPGDGVSDSIPAVIGERQPARLADGEFVIPARIVSELGNGSTEAGARKLYAMMERVQKARGKTTGKDKVAKNTRADKYLPA